MRRLLTVAAADDWAELRRRHLTTVLDPAVLRAGEEFFAPAGAVRTVDAGALMTFVDAVLLWDEIPVFAACPLLAPLKDVFWEVRVSGDPGNAYAQRLSTEDDAAVRLGCSPRPAEPRAVSFRAAPTFLPLLLQEEDILTTAHLADRLMVWRTTRAVREYRGWLAGLHASLAQGHRGQELERDLTAITRLTGGGNLEAAMGVDAWLVPPAEGPGGRHLRLLFRPRHDAGLSAHLRRIWSGG